MYGTTYLVPLFLAQARGFSALQIGETVFVVGLAQLVLSPFNVYIARAMDLRLMLAIGLGLFAYSMYLTAGLTNQTGFWELVVPQAVRGIALMFCYVPANMIALGTLPQDTMKNAAGLYNLMRDLGGAIGLASIGTIMNARLHFHWNRLIEDINPARASAAVSRRSDEPVRSDDSRRSPPRRDQAARQSDPARGAGFNLQ